MKYTVQLSQLCILILLSFYALGQTPSSKRKAPKEVIPVIAENIKYTAPTSKMGYIVAIDATTNKEIWNKKIYEIRYNRQLESDVQDVFIDSIYIKKEKLYIHTESRKLYVMDMKTQAVQKKFGIRFVDYRLVF